MNEQKNTILILLGLTALSAIIRLYNLEEQSLWMDEVTTIAWVEWFGSES